MSCNCIKNAGKLCEECSKIFTNAILEEDMPAYEPSYYWLRNPKDAKDAKRIAEAISMVPGTNQPTRLIDIKCLTKGCSNRTSQGTFIGDLCGPCHRLITSGEINKYSADFITLLAQENDKLKKSLIDLIGWTDGGNCSDCDMFREAPSRIVFRHHKECSHLVSINKALTLLGRKPEESHDFEDADAEMLRLANERVEKCRKK